MPLINTGVKTHAIVPLKTSPKTEIFIAESFKIDAKSVSERSKTQVDRTLTPKLALGAPK